MKDLTQQFLTKKADTLTQEKEQLYFESQKKLEAMQMKLLESSTNSSASAEESLSKVIGQLNESVNEFKTFFDKKFTSFMENFDVFKQEYNDRDDKFKQIINEKSVAIIDLVQKHGTGNWTIIANEMASVYGFKNRPTSRI